MSARLTCAKEAEGRASQPNGYPSEQPSSVGQRPVSIRFGAKQA